MAVKCSRQLLEKETKKDYEDNVLEFDIDKYLYRLDRLVKKSREARSNSKGFESFSTTRNNHTQTNKLKNFLLQGISNIA